ncbi:MAG: putative bifunctional diguanylate cyclase/phosphodiesterase [Betaproteobacteria bacterium]
MPDAPVRAPNVDYLTGLPRLAQALVDISALSRRQETSEALGIISLFVLPAPELYRLTLEAAQNLRIAVSNRLSRSLRQQDRIYTVSHWEWLIILPDLVSPAPLTLAMMKLRSVLDEAFETLDGTRMQLNCYCGAAFWPDDGDDAIHLTQSARIARLYAERNGSGAELYQRSMDMPEEGEAKFLAALRQALAGNGSTPLYIYLQPQISLTTGRCTGAEALLRWPQADQRSIPPHHIIAALKKLGLRHNFTRWLLNQAMQSITSLSAAGIDIPISVNLSATDLLDVELPDLVTQSLATWDVSPNRLRLEITETMMVEESQQVTDVLHRLSSIGVTLAIDDFGTGYAGMSYLQRLPVEEVKIDQSFVLQAVHQERDREIILSITQLAHRLKLTVVAEGVENQATADLLRTLGCEFAQGFLYAEALPIEEFIDWCYLRQLTAKEEA